MRRRLTASGASYNYVHLSDIKAGDKILGFRWQQFPGGSTSSIYAPGLIGYQNGGSTWWIYVYYKSDNVSNCGINLKYSYGGNNCGTIESVNHAAYYNGNYRTWATDYYTPQVIDGYCHCFFETQPYAVEYPYTIKSVSFSGAGQSAAPALQFWFIVA